MAMLARASEWADAEVTQVRTEVLPKRCRPAALHDVAPAVDRVRLRMFIQLGAVVVGLWLIRCLL